jgi:hypothetical protein
MVTVPFNPKYKRAQQTLDGISFHALASFGAAWLG